jgi:hypothetical protein
MVRRVKKALGKGSAALLGNTHFRKRYDDVELARVAMLQRLDALDAKARAHPGFKRAATLLNQTFRKASFAQRMAVLAAAEWLIDLLETLSTFA